MVADPKKGSKMYGLKSYIEYQITPSVSIQLLLEVKAEVILHPLCVFVILWRWICRTQTAQSITDTNTLTGCTRDYWTSLVQQFQSPLYQTNKWPVSTPLDVKLWSTEGKKNKCRVICFCGLFQGDLRKSSLRCAWSDCRAGWPGCAGIQLFPTVKFSRLSSRTRMRRCVFLLHLFFLLLWFLEMNWEINVTCKS